MKNKAEITHRKPIAIIGPRAEAAGVSRLVQNYPRFADLQIVALGPLTPEQLLAMFGLTNEMPYAGIILLQAELHDAGLITILQQLQISYASASGLTEEELIALNN